MVALSSGFFIQYVDYLNTVNKQWGDIAQVDFVICGLFYLRIRESVIKK